MSTGPGPTRKSDGSADASVNDIADLLVEDESHQGRVAGEQSLDEGLDVMLETPGPVLVSTFMPPPPSPAAEDAEESEGRESSESGEEPGESTNLAYEDLLAKLVLPAKAPEPEPALPALAAPLPMPETLMAPEEPTPSVAFKPTSSANYLLSAPTEERTLVTVNPLVAEEQEAAYREGRSASREQPLMVQDEMQPASTEPVVAGAARSRFRDLMLGGALVLGGFMLAVVFLKLIMPTPAPPPPVVIAPALPPPPAAPPAHVEPLPPSPTPPAPAAAQPEAEAPAAAVPENAVPAGEEAAAQPKAHRATHKATHVAAPKPAAPKPVAAVAPKVAPAPTPAAKAPKAPAGKKSKGSGYADPFDN
jgi:hypothetical protein